MDLVPITEELKDFLTSSTEEDVLKKEDKIVAYRDLKEKLKVCAAHLQTCLNSAAGLTSSVMNTNTPRTISACQCVLVVCCSPVRRVKCPWACPMLVLCTTSRALSTSSRWFTQSLIFCCVIFHCYLSSQSVNTMHS